MGLLRRSAWSRRLNWHRFRFSWCGCLALGRNLCHKSCMTILLLTGRAMRRRNRGQNGLGDLKRNRCWHCLQLSLWCRCVGSNSQCYAIPLRLNRVPSRWSSILVALNIANSGWLSSVSGGNRIVSDHWGSCGCNCACCSSTDAPEILVMVLEMIIGLWSGRRR